MIRRVLIGRHEERRRLRAALADAREGRGRTIVLRGEPGIGTTAVLEDVRSAEEGFRVLSARGVESESDLLRPVAGRIDGRPTAPRTALRVLIDDTRWLDLPTREVVLFCARRLQDDPVAVIAAVREAHADEVGFGEAGQMRLHPLGDERGPARARRRRRLAEKIIERHLGSVYRTRGPRSRGEPARLMADPAAAPHPDADGESSRQDPGPVRGSGGDAHRP
jgi:hypothetical protein